MGMALGMMIAFLGGHVIAWVTMACHNGLSYSRSFVNALIVLCLIVALVMMVMANNLLIAFGLMAVFNCRFRNVLPGYPGHHLHSGLDHRGHGEWHPEVHHGDCRNPRVLRC